MLLTGGVRTSIHKPKTKIDEKKDSQGKIVQVKTERREIVVVVNDYRSLE